MKTFFHFLYSDLIETEPPLASRPHKILQG